MRRFRLFRRSDTPQRDVTEFHQPGEDRLTGLLNQHRWEKALPSRETIKHPCFVSLVNLDHLKRFHDVHGHPMSDEAIRFVASVTSLHACVPGPYSAVFRVGGEEIAVLWSSPELAEVTRRAEAMRAAVQACGVGFTVTLVTTDVRQGEIPSTVLNRLRSLMRTAKTGGRNRSVLDSELLP